MIMRNFLATLVVLISIPGMAQDRYLIDWDAVGEE